MDASRKKVRNPLWFGNAKDPNHQAIQRMINTHNCPEKDPSCHSSPLPRLRRYQLTCSTIYEAVSPTEISVTPDWSPSRRQYIYSPQVILESDNAVQDTWFEGTKGVLTVHAAIELAHRTFLRKWLETKMVQCVVFVVG